MIRCGVFGEWLEERRWRQDTLDPAVSFTGNELFAPDSVLWTSEDCAGLTGGVGPDIRVF